MKWDKELINMEDEILKKLHALRIYQLEGNWTTIDKMFPNFKAFVNENKDRDFGEVERELMEGLYHAQLIYV